MSELQSDDPGYLRLGMFPIILPRCVSLCVFSGLILHPAGYLQADLPKAETQSTSEVAVQA